MNGLASQFSEQTHGIHFRQIVGKFRPRLIELTSFKPKLLIRYIINKTC